MVYTYKNLRDQVLRIVDETGETTTETLVKELMNQAHQARCMERKWNFLLHPKEYSFTTVAGQRLYTLHQEFDRPFYFFNTVTKRFLTEVPKEHVGEQEESVDDSVMQTSIQRFCLFGETPFKAQPSTASTISIVSDSASDTGSNYQIVVKGEDADGEVFAEILTMNGTTPVVSTNSFTFLTSITKNQSFNGNLTVTCGGTTVLTLLPWEMGRTYKQIYFLEPPVGGEVIKYRFYHQPLVLINDYDIPELPGANAQGLVWDTLLLLASYLTNVSPHQLEVWKSMSMTWELNLHAHEMQGQSIESQPSFFKDFRGE